MSNFAPTSDWLWLTVWPVIVAASHMLVALFASSHVVLTKRDTRSAIGWAGVIWLTPFFGSVLYFVFGINRIQRRARQLRRGQSAIERTPGRRHVDEDVLQRVLGGDGQHLARLAKYVSRLTNLAILDGNQITPLTTGERAYRQMLAAIDAAEHSVSLMTYIFDNDEAGREFVAALARAQERGVHVRIIIDDVGSRYTWPSIKGLLREHKIPFAAFLPTLIPGKLHYANLRSHRKILVVDGKLGFTGGMNIRQGHRGEGSHPIRDLHFRVEGPVVEHLRDTFASDWEFAAGELPDGPEWTAVLPSAGSSLCRGVADGPDIDYDKILLTILGAIGCAQHSLDIVTPYFLPEQPLITALNVAAMRGVTVNIFLPEVNNLRLVQWASTAQLWQVLQRGCRVWLTPPPFDHTKLMVVDGVWSLVGSSNWDARSLRLNFEFNLEVYDQEFASELLALVSERRSVSREITLAEVDSRPLWKRLRDGISRLALPYL